TREYPREWEPGEEPYYPVNDEKNEALYRKYAALAKQERNVLFGGRPGAYRYYDMDQTVAAALRLVKSILAEERI
ncbi:MAG: UDP-galactopyranose mutase, partial [Lachnospiraceae bacterium]|nr:UDP-galactopyranose mutase [Candidatus Hippenecus merdae]